MSDETGNDIAAIVPFVRGDTHVRFPDEMRARCFVHFSTDAARNCAEVERLIAEEFQGTNDPVPTARSIAMWAREEGWHEQADALWRATEGWSIEQLRVYVLANAILGQRRRHEVLTGKITDNDTAARYLKAGELSDRFIEKILPIGALRPPDTSKAEFDWQNASTEEKEAYAREITQGRKAKE